MSKLKVLIIIAASLSLLLASDRVFADDACAGISDLAAKRDCYQRLVEETAGRAETLQSQIDYLDAQISLTRTQIDLTSAKLDRLENDIASVSGKIDNISNSLAHVSTVLVRRISETYIAGRSDPVLYLLSSVSFGDFWQRLEYLRLAQKHDKNLMIQMAETQKNYNDQKSLLEDKKKQVEALSLQLKAYQAQLNNQNKEKQTLLTETKNDEQLYRQLRDQAAAQLAAFQGFVSSQGGAGLLSNQTKCDDWGCYYNQRDSSWGALPLNHTGYTLANSGCLITSMAMVATHYGRRSVTPLTINSLSSNFAVYYPAFLNYDIDAGGNLTRVRWQGNYLSTADKISFIDSELPAPVVVGIGSGPSHFVVLVSGSKGNYLMNDPFVENGQKIPFTSKYSLASISEIDSVR